LSGIEVDAHVLYAGSTAYPHGHLGLTSFLGLLFKLLVMLVRAISIVRRCHLVLIPLLTEHKALRPSILPPRSILLLPGGMSGVLWSISLLRDTFAGLARRASSRHWVLGSCRLSLRSLMMYMAQDLVVVVPNRLAAFAFGWTWACMYCALRLVRRCILINDWLFKIFGPLILL
jgi:hypothetical protein